MRKINKLVIAAACFFGIWAFMLAANVAVIAFRVEATALKAVASQGQTPTILPIPAATDIDLLKASVIPQAAIAAGLLTVTATLFIFGYFIPKKEANKFAQELFAKFMTDKEFAKARLITQQYLEPGFSKKYDEFCHLNFKLLFKKLLSSTPEDKEAAEKIRMITSFFYAIRLAQKSGLIEKHEKVFSEIYAYYWTNIIRHRVLPCKDEDSEQHELSNMAPIDFKYEGQFRFINELATWCDIEWGRRHFELRFREWEKINEKKQIQGTNAKALARIKGRENKYENDPVFVSAMQWIISWEDPSNNTYKQWKTETDKGKTSES